MIYTILTIIIFYCFGIDSYGFSLNGDVSSHFIYCFQHASFIHMAINCIAIAGWYRAIRYDLSNEGVELYWKNGLVFELCMIAAAIVASFGSAYEIPTIGASGIAFAMMGFYSMWYDKYRFIICLCITILCNMCMYIVGGVNIKVHALAYVYGAAIGLLWGGFRFKK